MATNSFGNIFKFTTFGESHGKLIGVTIDGCPAGIEVTEDEINESLKLRAPGKNQYTSPRNEIDQVEIVSGIFSGQTTGAPITLLIPNKDHDSSKYEEIKDLLRPGHANYTYLQKYGIFDYKGGGRASARETAARVAAGVIAGKILAKYNIKVIAYINSVYNVDINHEVIDDIINSGDDVAVENLKSQIVHSAIFCPDINAEIKIKQKLTDAKEQGDSLGAVVGFAIINCPPGIGDPIYEKLDARLAFAMLSIPASKGFELGSGFAASRMLGSQHNDEFANINNKVVMNSNNAGGLLGGISTGMPIFGKVAFKPTSSIQKVQSTVDLNGNKASFVLPQGSRHDPCVAIRAVPIVEAMCNLVLADLMLMNRVAKL
jgi:chorismate synthase